MDKRYFFKDKDIYFQNKKLPPRKVELFNIRFENDFVIGYDEDGDSYKIEKEYIFSEEVK